MTTISRDRIAWHDWAWIAWRHHRVSIVAAAALIVLGSLYFTTNNSHVLDIVTDNFVTQGWPYAPTVFTVIVSTFWAAPMVSREYENRTSVFAWGQDASPQRWLIGRAVPLVAVAILLTTILTVSVSSHLSDAEFTSKTFEANPLVHTSYVLFGFALGLTFSVLLRQSPGAIGATLGVFVTFRILFSTLVRPYLWSPVHVYRDFKTDAGLPLPSGAYLVDSGWVDANGNPTTFSFGEIQDCAATINQDAQIACYRAGGVNGRYADFQPVGIMPAIQVIESLIYLVLTAALTKFVLVQLSKRRRI
jgi:hypothetical protein